MTETSSLLRSTATFIKTFPPTGPFPVTTSTSISSKPPLPNRVASNSIPQDEEEYTIKCICIYTDDDGNTVYCPDCDTWQHIECYYHDKAVPDEHFCAECRPRDLDGRKATERQRKIREHLEGGDRKVKRPSTKTSKKKLKDSSIPNEQTNGWLNHERQDSLPNGRDQPPPAKKPKTNHRTSGSIVSLNGESRKRTYSNNQSYPSPSKSPQDVYRFPSIPQYTTEFLELYERDDGTTDRYENEYTISASSFLSKWKSDRSLVVNHPDQQPNAKSPFVSTVENLEKISWPSVKLRTTTWDTAVDGKHPTWRYLVSESGVQKDQIMGEIKGEIGMLDEYCQQQSSQNRWHELSHPDPFVFFHPHMNIYIDSRKKGTMYRYLRRSCQPNVTLKTFVTDDNEMRHCLVASQDIKAGSELTAAWYINTGMFDMSLDRGDAEQLENQRCEWVSRVLANFGDCACDKTQCPWARLDRRTPIRPENASKVSTARRKKGKSKQAISPQSTGQTTNSRAGSEVIRGPDDDDQYDRRSTSDSSRSGARSRDLTPVNVAVLDAPTILGDGLTARELRKIQAAEKAFERKEVVGDKKKKKRTSGGSTLNTPSVGTSKQLGHSPGLVDGHQFSCSPPPPRALKDVSNRMTTTPRFQKPVRPIYKSVSVQTDPEDCDVAMPPPKRRKFSTPTQRLLKKVLQDRILYEQQESQSPPSMSPVASTQTGTMSIDVEMKDVSSALSPTTTSSNSSRSPRLSPTSTRETKLAGSVSLTYPSQAAHTQTNFKSTSPAPRLHLHTLPPVPVFPNGNSTTPGSANTTPALTTPSTAQSPNGLSATSPSYQSLNSSIVTPSPIKKKLSLGDYMSRRHQSSTPITEKSQAQAEAGMAENDRDPDMQRKDSNADSDTQSKILTTPLLAGNEGRTDNAVNGIDEAPIKDEDEPEYSPPGASPAPEDTFPEKPIFKAPQTTTAAGHISPDVANVLARLAQYSDKAQSQSAGSA